MSQTDKVLIEKKVNTVFLDIFGKNPQKWSEKQKKGSLFSPDIGLEAIDLMVLYRELEQGLGICFDTEDVTEQRFDVYDNIVAAVERKLAERREAG